MINKNQVLKIMIEKNVSDGYNMTTGHFSYIKCRTSFVLYHNVTLFM